jgi:MmyB-like transcription regulator ligand binding domain
LRPPSVIAGWNSSGLRQTKAGRPNWDDTTRTLGGRFLLEPDRIGGGGFADVFRATDRKTSELVAVKVLKDTVAVDPEDRAATDIVAVLRATVGRKPYDKAPSDLVGELLTRSDEFRVRWASTRPCRHGDSRRDCAASHT